MSHPASVLTALACLVVFTTTSSSAQRTPADSSTATHNWLVGASVGLPGYERKPVPELFTIGMNVTQIKPGPLGVDFSIGTMPRAFAFGAAVLGARAGLVLPIAPTADVVLLPSVGVSVVGGAAGEGGGAIGGINAGAAAVLWGDAIGFRTGITWHRFQDFRGSLWLVEVGFVRAR